MRCRNLRRVSHGHLRVSRATHGRTLPPERVDHGGAVRQCYVRRLAIKVTLGELWYGYEFYRPSVRSRTDVFLRTPYVLLNFGRADWIAYLNKSLL